MPLKRPTVFALASAAIVAGWALTGSGQTPAQTPTPAQGQKPAVMPLDPIRDRGQGVTPSYEGWYPNKDGTFTMLVGYFNRNRTETLDIPIGPNNRVEPGGPDRGQPTHFLARRQWGVFTVTVPADFGTQKLTWTLVANGQKNEIPLTLHPNYQVEPFKDPAMGNTPPVLRFEPNGPALQGPPIGIAATRTAIAGQPTPLEFYASDDAHEEPGRVQRGNKPAPPVTVFLSKFRGPGEIKFSNPRPEVAHATDGKVTATATFSEPGDYIVRVQANDSSGEGGGGFQCCWTNAHVAVKVSR